MKKSIAAGLLALGALQGCSTIGVDQMTSSGGMVTSARGGYVFDETPMKQIKQRDSLVVLTHLNWDPLAGTAGTHDVKWTWYADGKVVAVREKNMKFQASPFRLFWRIPAADFEPGHYRVDIAVDNKIVDTQEYDVVKS